MLVVFTVNGNNIENKTNVKKIQNILKIGIAQYSWEVPVLPRYNIISILHSQINIIAIPNILQYTEKPSSSI